MGQLSGDSFTDKHSLESHHKLDLTTSFSLIVFWIFSLLSRILFRNQFFFRSTLRTFLWERKCVSVCRYTFARKNDGIDLKSDTLSKVLIQKIKLLSIFDPFSPSLFRSNDSFFCNFFKNKYLMNGSEIGSSSQQKKEKNVASKT